MRGWLQGAQNFQKLWRKEAHLGALGQLGWCLFSPKEASQQGDWIRE